MLARDIYVGMEPTKVLEVSSDSSLSQRIGTLFPWKYSVDQTGSTVAFRGPYTDNPAAIFVARNTPEVIDELKRDGFGEGGILSDFATVLRRLGGL